MSAVAQTNGFSRLPEKPWSLIFSFLPSLNYLHLVSRLFHDTVDAEWNARVLCHQSFGKDLTEATKTPTTPYKDVYRQLSNLRTNYHNIVALSGGTVCYSEKTMFAKGLPATLRIPSMPIHHPVFGLPCDQQKAQAVNPKRHPSVSPQVPPTECNLSVVKDKVFDNLSPLNLAANGKQLSCQDSLQSDDCLPGSPPLNDNPLAEISDDPFKSDASIISLRNQPRKVGSTEEEASLEEEIDDLSNSLHRQHIHEYDDSVTRELKTTIPSRERTPTHSLQLKQFRNPLRPRYRRKKKQSPAAQTPD